MKRSVAIWLITLTVGWMLGWYTHSSYKTNSLSAASTSIILNRINDKHPVAIRPNDTQRSKTISPNDNNNDEDTFSVLASEPTLRVSKEYKIDQLKQLLTNNQFESAVALLTNTIKSGNYTISDPMRTLLFDHAELLSQALDFESAQQLLNIYLEQFYSDVLAYELLAQIYLRANTEAEALSALYNAKVHSIESIDVGRIDAKIHSVISLIKERYNREADLYYLLEIYKKLTQLEPNNPNYVFELANTQKKLGNYHAATQSLYLILHDVDLGERARLMLSSIEVQQSRMEPQTLEIPLERSGNHFVVDVTINQQQKLSLLIDTGASLTVIKPSALNGINSFYQDEAKTVWLYTANGKIPAPVINIDSIALGDSINRDVEIAVVELNDTDQIDGLLGMNVLNQYQFFIDQKIPALKLHIDKP